MSSILKVDEIQNTTGKTGLVITPDGTVTVPSVKFPEQSNPSGRVITSTTMSSYETGTWVPTLYSSGGGFTGTVNINSANYTKIGSTVWVSAYLNVNVTAVGSGDARIGDLPFTVADFVPFKAAYGNLVLSNGGFFLINTKSMVFVTDHSVVGIGFAGTSDRAIMVSGFYNTNE
mgnify:CR=1 FL=1